MSAKRCACCYANADLYAAWAADVHLSPGTNASQEKMISVPYNDHLAAKREGQASTTMAGEAWRSSPAYAELGWFAR